jgi:hypothetical protein
VRRAAPGTPKRSGGSSLQSRTALHCRAHACNRGRDHSLAAVKLTLLLVLAVAEVAVAVAVTVALSRRSLCATRKAHVRASANPHAVRIRAAPLASLRKADRLGGDGGE